MTDSALLEILPDWKTAVANMVTEDDEPVDNQFTEKQMRLLVEPLYNSWQPQPFEDAPEEPRPFIAAANVGVFTSPLQPPIVPDMFLSLDVTAGSDFSEKENRSYCIWVHEKAPDAVVEIISDKRGEEFGAKMNRYGRMNVRYYVTFDPFEVYDAPFVRVYERAIGWRYRLREDLTLAAVGLSLQMWRGRYETAEADWLRWCDLDGNIIPTGAERARAAQNLVEAEKERAARFAAKLREMGVDPDKI